jgi:2-iminobutanoate/2-iminopropanoate deaminase
MVRKNIIFTDKAPKPLGPYSQAVKIGYASTLYIAGQVGTDPATGKIVKGGIIEQTSQALKNLENILAEAKMSLDNVVKVSVFIKKPEDFKPMNEVYTRFFKEKFPARTTVIVKFPSDQMLIEIDCIAQK